MSDLKKPLLMLKELWGQFSFFNPKRFILYNYWLSVENYYYFL
jgi:hypothetical protein